MESDMLLLLKILATALFVALLWFAISVTNDDAWLSLWFSLFFFVGIPLSWFALRDLVMLVMPRWLGPSQALLHVIALFSAAVGYGLGVMAVNSGHEKAQLHQLMVVIFPLAVYATPLLMILNGCSVSHIKEFYIRTKHDER